MEVLNASGLMAMATASSPTSECPTCNVLMHPGWESVPGSFNLKSLRQLGTLRSEDTPEVWEEYHPHGTHSWSPDAPIAIGFYPYNRCDVYECIDCSRKYLRYGEYGGYYVDERIRPLNPKLVIQT